MTAAGRRVLAAAALALVLLASACGGGGGGSAPKPPKPPSGMTMVWSDEFNGAAKTGLSRKTWLYNVGTSYPGGAQNWGTNEVERMTDSTANVALDGKGHLAITPTRDASGAWHSGRVETQRTDFAAPAGGKVRIEATIQQPNVSGAQAAGYWPAFWLLGAPARPVGATNWPHIGEWDVMENINGRNSVWGTFHCGDPVGGPCKETDGISSGEKPCPGCRTGFHTYAIEFDRSTTPETLTWYLDNKPFHSVTSTQVDQTTWEMATHHGFFVILNVAMGGVFPSHFGGGPTPATKPGVPMLVDRVAVYSSKS